MLTTINYAASTNIMRKQKETPFNAGCFSYLEVTGSYLESYPSTHLPVTTYIRRRANISSNISLKVNNAKVMNETRKLNNDNRNLEKW